MSFSAIAPRLRSTRLEPTASVARQTLAGLLVAGVSAAFTLYLAHAVTVKDVAVLIVVVGTLWFGITRHTQLALAMFMLYLGLLDGYLKLATGSSYVTLVRDVLLYAIVIGLLLRAVVEGRLLRLPPLSMWVIAFVILVLIQIPNPNGGTLVHSLAGARQHLEFVPLFFLAYAYVRTVKALRVFVILLAVIAAANGIVGFVQFNESPQQFAQWGPGYAQRVLGEGNFAGGGRTFGLTSSSTSGSRPFGLGSDAGDGGMFGAVALAGILALAALYPARRYRAFALLMAVGAAVAVVTSQGRGVLISSVIIVLAFIALTATARNRLASLLGLLLVAGVVGLTVEAVLGSAGSAGVRYQGLSPSSLLATTNHARGRSFAAIPHNMLTYPFGAGLGTGGPASGSTPGASALTNSGTVDTETEFSFLVVETGIPGMLVLVGFTITLLALGLRRCRREPDHEARVLLAALLAPLAGLFVLFFTSTVTPSVPAGPYIWATGGVFAYWFVTRPAGRGDDAAHSRAGADSAASQRQSRALRRDRRLRPEGI